MVTKIHQSVKKRLYLKENREAKGISAETMGGRLGIARESVYRQERNPRGLNTVKATAYAAALDMKLEDLYRLPGTPKRPSLDAMIETAPESVQKMAVDIVKRLVSGG